MNARKIVIVILMVAAGILMLIPFGYWIANPKLSQMEVFLDNIFYWIGAIVCAAWARILIKE
jgi:hypothetical protein